MIGRAELVLEPETLEQLPTGKVLLLTNDSAPEEWLGTVMIQLDRPAK